MGQNLIVAKNIKTGETLEFASQKEAADYFMDLYFIEISSKNVGRMVGQKKPYRKTWIVRFKGAEDGKIHTK